MVLLFSACTMPGCAATPAAGSRCVRNTAALYYDEGTGLGRSAVQAATGLFGVERLRGGVKFSGRSSRPVSAASATDQDRHLPVQRRFDHLDHVGVVSRQPDEHHGELGKQGTGIRVNNCVRGNDGWVGCRGVREGHLTCSVQRPDWVSSGTSSFARSAIASLCRALHGTIRELGGGTGPPTRGSR